MLAGAAMYTPRPSGPLDSSYLKHKYEAKTEEILACGLATKNTGLLVVLYFSVTVCFKLIRRRCEQHVLRQFKKIPLWCAETLSVADRRA
jgi:2-keto-3-deoxy-galactonokinase